MNKLFRLLSLAGIMTFSSLTGWGINTKTTVSQVTSAVTLSDETDYIITSATPFTDDGRIDIVNTEHAVVIMESVKPSAAISIVGEHLLINGAKAVNDVNCQVKIYNNGCIVMPYEKNYKPLTVFSGQNFEGDSCKDFGLENSNGFMNTLSTQKLNNRIRSFKLKRGYMVTFALRAGGRGYSRCFIAADKDLEMATMPAILDETISSYRIFKWYNTGKQALANDTRSEAIKALNVTSCYSFGLGEDKGVDCECVPHHIYEDWPSAAACGSATYSPHMKTNNEPGNSADDHPQTVKQILDNWENLMATGMRLCSPSSHDGSLAHLREFLDSIDARGWRCDIIDLHCYWNEWNFSNSIKTWVDTYHRPVWISEWVWGSSWGNNGIFAEATGTYRDNPTQEQLQKNKEVVERICTALNGFDYIERYYYWNSEANCSKLYYDGKLTPAGEMYSKLNAGVGYNGRYDFAPKTPKQSDPTNLVINYDKETHTAHLTWYEPNGETNKKHCVQRRLSESSRWETLADMALKDEGASYSYNDTLSAHGYQYRIYVEDMNYTARNTKTVTALSSTLEAGDAVAIGEQTKYLGGNIFTNGDFDFGFTGWLDGNGDQLTGQPYFQIIPVGGTDGGSYLQTYGHGSNVSKFEQSVLTTFDIEAQADYYLSVDNCNGASGGSRVMLVDTDGTSTNKLLLTNKESTWLTQKTTFNSEANTKLQVWLRNLYCKAQFDKLRLCRMFDTQEEALADGLKWALERGEAFKTFNTLYPDLNYELTENALAATTPKEVDLLVNTALAAYNNKIKMSDVVARAEALLALDLYGSDALQTAIDNAKSASTANDINSSLETLQMAIDTYLPMTNVTGIVQSPQLASETNWTVKCGTFTGGDQRLNTKDGVTFWNAWWSGISASEGESQTMEIKQEIDLSSQNDGFSHGLYAISCKASTEHFCLSDQHAYMTDGTTTVISQPLTSDYYDLPSVTTADRWQTLTTLPIYLDDNAKATIGFVGSKQGAIDNAWHEIGNVNSTGDLREGWWCATGFELFFHPLYKVTVEPDTWGVICLPYALHPSKNITYFQIAGINPEYTQLCIEPVDEVAAGVPVIYKASAADVAFNEYGVPTTDAGDAPGNLRGFFSASRAQTGYYILQEGEWNKVGSSRPRRPKYSALIRPISADYNIPVIADWTGLTMPINGVTDEEISAASISQPSTSVDNVVIYTLDGRRISANQPLKSGVYVKVSDNKSCKFIVK